MDLDCPFVEALIETRLTKAECADFLGVDGSTVRRWCSGKHKPPKSAVEALRMLAGFTPRLSRRGKGFHGWRFKDGLLYTDEGMGFTPAQIRSIWHVDQLLRCQNQNLKQLKAEIERLQPAKLPDNVIMFPGKVIGS